MLDFWDTGGPDFHGSTVHSFYVIATSVMRLFRLSKISLRESIMATAFDPVYLISIGAWSTIMNAPHVVCVKGS